MDELFEKEIELLREKAKLIAEGKLREPRLGYLAFRVGHTISQIYKIAPSDVKQSVRSTFEAVLLAWLLGGRVQVEQQNLYTPTAPTIYNININKAEANVKVDIDLDMKKINEELDELEKKINQLEQTIKALPSDALSLQYKRAMDKNMYDIKTELYKAKRDIKALYVNILKSSLQN